MTESTFYFIRLWLGLVSVVISVHRFRKYEILPYIKIVINVTNVCSVPHGMTLAVQLTIGAFVLPTMFHIAYIELGLHLKCIVKPK